jgi:LacI family transcriptional regulator
MNNHSTIRDVARKCRVSIATVSRVINHKPGVRKETAARINSYIRKKDYNPYRNVAILKLIKQRVIRVIMPYISTAAQTDQFYMKALAGIRTTAEQHQYEVVLAGEREFNQPGIPRATTALPATAMGVILLCPVFDWESEIERLLEWQVPVALVNRRSKHNVLSVHDNRPAGVRHALEHLAGLGYASIGCLAHQGAIFQDAAACREAFHQLGRENAGYTVHVVNHQTGDSETAILDRLHREQHMPRALFIVNDVGAIRAMQHLQRLGYRVPQDVAVVGFDNVGMGEMVYPTLTTIDVPVDKMAALAARQIIDHVAGAAGPFAMELTMENELVVRESCGAHETTNVEVRSAK